MQKRVVHLILAIIFLTTTIVQSFGSALAVAVNKETMTANTTSKIVNPRSAIEGANSVSESLASSLQSQSTSSASTSSDSKSSSKSSDAKSSSNSTSEKESTKAPTTSKSVLINPRDNNDFTPTDPDSAYPDFSTPLSGQVNIVTVGYDAQGNAHTPNEANNEIPYPFNAFPTFIPGVSSETDNGDTSNNTLLMGDDLTDDDYIYYKKVMSYNDGKKIHWIDIKQKFVGLERHGWYNDWPQYKAHGFSDPAGLNSLAGPAQWRFSIGKGTNLGETDKMLGISTTFKVDAFKKFQIQYPAGGKQSIGPQAYRQYRQATKVKLEFYDNAGTKNSKGESTEPIAISGFLSVADLDHRDYIQFSKSSNINKVYVTRNDKSGSILKGTSLSKDAVQNEDDPMLTIVNSNGNLDYMSKSDLTTSLDAPDSDNDIVQDNNTDAWATVTFDKTNSIQYSVSDPQRLDFIATSLVPVAFSAPAKAGDGEEYNAKWDNDTIDYKVAAVLPYRGSTIQDPQYAVNSTHTTSTFHAAKEFKLVDPIDKNLTVSASDVKISDQAGNDVTSNFTINVTDNKVTAEAKTAFLGANLAAGADTTAVEKNYAKTYSMDIHATLKADADLGDYSTVKANGKSYAVIPNKATLYDVKKDGADEESFTSNEAYGHVQVPDPVREVQDMKQEIKNYDTAGEDCQPVVDDISNTTGNVGDKIGYRLSFKAKTTNTASITDAMINQIQLSGLGAPSNVVVTVGGKAATGTLVKISDNVYAIKIDTPIKAGQEVTVTFDRTTEGAVAKSYMQLGLLKAVSLTTQPGGADAGDDGNLFNPANLTLKAQNNTATIQQFIKNRDTANESWKGPGIGDDKAETSGVPGNIIDYKFKITPGAKNTADLLATALKDIAMKESGGMTLVNPEGSVDNTKQVKITVDGSQPIYIGGNPISNNTELNDVFTPLTKGKGMTIEYSAKINATAAVQDVTNDANFYASNLTGNMPATSTVTDKAHKTPANQSILHITMPLQTPTIKQTINNTTSGVASTNDGKTAVGKAGDIIDYQFYVNAPATADKNLINAALKDIQMQMDATTDMTLVPYDATATTPGTTGQEVKVLMSGMGGNPAWASVADFKNGTVAIPANPKPTNSFWIQVNYRMKIGTSATDGETITNDGNLYADNLQGTDHKMAFNQTVLNIKNKHAATSLKQTIHNITRPALDDKTETDPAKTATKSAGKLGDTIEYKFSAKATDTNTSDLMNVALDHIKMATTLSPADPNYMTLVKDPTISISINNGGTITTGTEADFNAGKFAFGNVTAKATISVTYRMKVGTDKAQTITNSGWLTADNLEGTTVMPNVTPEQKGIQFNDTILTIVPQVNHATIEQFIRNPRTNPTDQAWFGPGYGDGKAETTAAPGDEITYLFKIQLPTDANGKYTNDAALLNAALKDIAMNKPDDMTLVDLDANGTKVQIDYATSPTEHRVNVNSLADLKDVALLSPLDTTNKTMMSSTGVVKVQYRAKVNANAPAQDVTNDANFYASNLTGDLKDQTVANYQQKTKANQSIVHIQGKKEVTIKQQIKTSLTQAKMSATQMIQNIRILKVIALKQVGRKMM
ncbi:MAG: isopeptide-forming domain-containing fimbrial protein [Bacillota bacterium]|nr:isopeptide-forming domain-containing fimbrial protein [Bacillota bacterium]